MAKKKLRIAGFEAGITKSEALEIFLVALFVVFVEKVLGLIHLSSALGGDIGEIIIVLLAFPLGMGIFKVFAKRKWLSMKEVWAGSLRGVLLILIILIFGVFNVGLPFSVSINLFITAVLTMIIAEFTIDPLFKLS